MSSEYVERLRRRAKAFLHEAENVSDCDLAMFFLEQALQLYIKSVYYELFGASIRGHRLRELLATLTKALEEHGFNRSAGRLLDFVDENRRVLIELEEAYTMSRYGDVEYRKGEVSQALSVAKKLVDLLEEVRSDVKLG